MKTIITLIAALATTIAFAADPAKPTAPAKKQEMKLAKKKESPKQDPTKSSKTVKDKKAVTKAEPTANR